MILSVTTFLCFLTYYWLAATQSATGILLSLTQPVVSYLSVWSWVLECTFLRSVLDALLSLVGTSMHTLSEKQLNSGISYGVTVAAS